MVESKYIERRSVKDVPPDAIIISEKEAFNHYLNQIYGRSSSQDIIPLKYGFVWAGGVAFGTNLWIVMYYFNRLRFSSLPTRIMANVTLVATPAALAAAFHMHHCMRGIILQNTCTNCLYTRAMLIQNCFSVLYSVVPSSYLLLTLACMIGSYPVPGFNGLENMKESYKIWLKFTKRIVPRILICVILNTVSISVITYQEMQSFTKFNETLEEQNRKLREIVAQYQNENNVKKAQT